MGGRGERAVGSYTGGGGRDGRRKPHCGGGGVGSHTGRGGGAVESHSEDGGRGVK